ncbi:hypothetical protein VST04_22975 [Bacillus paranthracis]|uniref:hypothetical protein n=1 Tax=Bacillus paranthracis TaxID=2026186 RepID=UPI002DD41E38|nr:hypothetical protein [Bacillus paranthracis]MEC4620961.1 hypothetical protein [Bacillus paranthracis]
MSPKYPIANVYLHPDLIAVDLAGIAQTMTEQQFHEFYFGTFQDAVEDAMTDPFRPNTPLRFKLEGWSRLDFHSMRKPPRGFKRDYRFVYKYECDTHDFYKLAVGVRNAKGINGDSVYHTSQHRPKAPGVWKKETE